LLCPIANQFPAATVSVPKSLVKAIRPHQWVKNIIVFLPAVASHRIFEFQVLGNSILAFIAFSLCASGLYVMNDLLDLPSDRLHKSKSKRPFAAGNLPLSWGVAMCPALLLAAFVICIFLPVQYSAVLTTYILLTTAYTFYFKSRVLVDVFFLAALYTIRLIAGHEAANLPYSHWLTGFSIFFFLSLALIKRGSELVVLRNAGKLRTDGRGYQTSDVSTICNQGMVAGGLSVLYLAMYVSSPEIHLRYSSPDLLLALCPLLFYWLSRMWLLVDRGWMHHDPVVFALQDRVSYYILSIATIIGLIAITYP
jgi:4-hydroxybenzoate polyprenyltransferase